MSDNDKNEGPPLAARAWISEGAPEYAAYKVVLDAGSTGDGDLAETHLCDPRAEAMGVLQFHNARETLVFTFPATNVQECAHSLESLRLINEVVGTLHNLIRERQKDFEENNR